MTSEPVHAVSSPHLAVRNAAGLWTALGESRGHDVLRRTGFLAVGGHGRSHLRILVLGPDPAPDDLAEITDLVRRRPATGVVVEDAFGTLDLSALGLTARRLPVMIRRSGAPLPPSTLEVTRVERDDQLELAERVVVQDFPLAEFQPHRPGEVFPAAMLRRDDVVLHLVAREGEPAGACLVVLADGCCGLYWVTTVERHRSRGVGRQLMHAVLADLPELPITLTAARAGKPLYDSLGFAPVVEANWWM